jgi:hypothetical protein
LAVNSARRLAIHGWQNEIRVHGAHGFSLPTMETNLTETPKEHLVREMFDRWGDLLDVVSFLENGSRQKAGECMKRIRRIQSELNERDATDSLRQSEQIRQLANHGERLDAFLTRFLLICVEHNFAPARPLAQSFSEYNEAWEQRKLPSRAEFRQELERRIREKEKQKR